MVSSHYHAIGKCHLVNTHGVWVSQHPEIVLERLIVFHEVQKV